MNRPITGFRLDDHGNWTALLSCGHAEHVRHTPPFTNRPRVTTAFDRDSRLGEPLPCVRCDRFKLPERVVAYQHTPVFTERSIPASLRTKHATAAGVWARSTVTECTLRYRVDALGIEIDLTADRPGIVVPEIVHRVSPPGRSDSYAARSPTWPPWSACS